MNTKTVLRRIRNASIESDDDDDNQNEYTKKKKANEGGNIIVYEFDNRHFV